MLNLENLNLLYWTVKVCLILSLLLGKGTLHLLCCLVKKTKKPKTHPQFAQEVDTISSKCVHYKNLKCSPEQRQSLSLPIRLTAT